MPRKEDVRRGDGSHEELDRHDHRAHRLGSLCKQGERASVKHSSFDTTGMKERTGESVFESRDRRKDLGESNEDVGCVKRGM